jgi:hypothetical protein
MEYVKPTVVIYDEAVVKEIEATFVSTCHCTASGARASPQPTY